MAYNLQSPATDYAPPRSHRGTRAHAPRLRAALTPSAPLVPPFPQCCLHFEPLITITNEVLRRQSRSLFPRDIHATPPSSGCCSAQDFPFHQDFFLASPFRILLLRLQLSIILGLLFVSLSRRSVYSFCFGAKRHSQHGA